MKKKVAAKIEKLKTKEAKEVTKEADDTDSSDKKEDEKKVFKTQANVSSDVFVHISRWRKQRKI